MSGRGWRTWVSSTTSWRCGSFSKAPNGNSASHIAYVDSKDNQGAGSSIGGRLRKYCNGTPFKVVPFGERTRTAVIVVALRDGKQVHQVVRRR